MDMQKRWTHERMLRALADAERLPVGRDNVEWEHNAAVLDDLIHDGFARGPAKLPHDGMGAYFSTLGIRITDYGRQRLGESARSSFEQATVDQLQAVEALLVDVHKAEDEGEFDWLDDDQEAMLDAERRAASVGTAIAETQSRGSERSPQRNGVRAQGCSEWVLGNAIFAVLGHFL
jgi:hypothetical protein